MKFKLNNNKKKHLKRSFMIVLLFQCWWQTANQKKLLAVDSDTYSMVGPTEGPIHNKSLKYSISLDRCLSSHLKYNTIYNM